jgi:hypothetical protein
MSTVRKILHTNLNAKVVYVYGKVLIAMTEHVKLLTVMQIVCQSLQQPSKQQLLLRVAPVPHGSQPLSVALRPPALLPGPKEIATLMVVLQNRCARKLRFAGFKYLILTVKPNL